MRLLNEVYEICNDWADDNNIRFDDVIWRAHTPKMYECVIYAESLDFRELRELDNLLDIINVRLYGIDVEEQGVIYLTLWEEN